MILVAFLLEVVLLYFLSRFLTQSLYALFILVFRSRTTAVSATTLLLFPGTVVHELAHLFTAEILGVRTGKLNLVPENIREESVKTGSIAIARTDPFRRAAIGLAPVFVGLAVLSALSYWLPGLIESVFRSGTPVLSNPNALFLILNSYLLFSVSNSMFSSSEDLKGFMPFAITVSLLVSAAYWAGFRIGLTGQALALATKIVTTLIVSLGWVLAVNVILLIMIHVWVVLMRKIFHQRITN